MGCYFQMGHDTENLVGEQGLEAYSGIVLSPINRAPSELESHIGSFCQKGAFDIVLDPQLYFPRSEQGHLREHPYFPRDFDTADLGSVSWWEELAKSLADYAARLGVTSVASPCCVPKTWSDDFYLLCADVANATVRACGGSKIRVLTSVVVATSDLVQDSRPRKIASILSGKRGDGYYIVFVSDKEPRRELSEEDEIFGMLSLIRELRHTGRSILVSHCSSDMVLSKVAGADHCATGKFFNLRRFTKSRYEEPSGGGGQLPYWFEHSLMAFLRQADVLRLQREGHSGLLGVGPSGNCWASQIREHLSKTPGDPWLALSWRQYLSWFAEAERGLVANQASAMQWLKEAEKNWLTLEDDEILFDERRNDGTWVRAWRQSLIRLKKDDREGGA